MIAWNSGWTTGVVKDVQQHKALAAQQCGDEGMLRLGVGGM